MFDYTVTWLPTGQVAKIKAGNDTVAWTEALNIFKESLIREMIPKIDESKSDNDLELVATFKKIQASDYLTVVRTRLYKVEYSTIVVENGIEGSGLSRGCIKSLDNPLTALSKEFPVTPPSFQSVAANNWVEALFTYGDVSEITIKFSYPQKPRNLNEVHLSSIKISLE